MQQQRHNLTREQWRNLYHSWRTALRSMTLPQAAAWVAFYSFEDAALLDALTESSKTRAEKVA